MKRCCHSIVVGKVYKGQILKVKMEYEINNGEKTNPKPNIFPKGYEGPRSFAEAMAMDWDPHEQEWSRR